MNRLPRLTGKEMIRFLRRQGFDLARIQGSHHFLEQNQRRTCVPVHGNQHLRVGTLCSILRDIDMSPTEFEKLWRV